MRQAHKRLCPAAIRDKVNRGVGHTLGLQALHSQVEDSGAAVGQGLGVV